MSRAFAIAALGLTLSGCQGVASGFPTAGVTNTSSVVRLRHGGSTDCSYSFARMRKKGGEVNVPAPPGEENFFGGFRYGPISNFERGSSIMHGCYDNAYDTPIPAGYTPDWFGEWNLCGEGCSFAFGNAKVLMRMYSSTWVAKRTYYLYLYSYSSGTLIESYSIGTVHQSTKYPPYLKFPSPFANGFVYPANDNVSFEIVHASQ